MPVFLVFLAYFFGYILNFKLMEILAGYRNIFCRISVFILIVSTYKPIFIANQCTKIRFILFEQLSIGPN
jgi:hypothetical protein